MSSTNRIAPTSRTAVRRVAAVSVCRMPAAGVPDLMEPRPLDMPGYRDDI